MLCAYLRPSRIDGAKHAAAILKLLVGRLRQKWPQVRIIFRGDSGFCRQRIINYCERAGVNYIIGLARNAWLEKITQFLELAMKDEYERTGSKQREVGDFVYAAQSWARERRVAIITAADHERHHGMTATAVTSLSPPQASSRDR